MRGIRLAALFSGLLCAACALPREDYPSVAETPNWRPPPSAPYPDDDAPGEFYKDDGVWDDDVGVLDYKLGPGPGL